jgi:hypothetical protein
MMQCPECHELFDDGQKFCDVHGAALVDETVLLRDALTDSSIPPAKPDLSNVLATALIGIFVGVALCLLIYILFLSPPASTHDADRDRRGSSSQTASGRPNQMIPAAGVPRSIEAPTPEASPSEESPSPSPAATSAPATAPAAPPARMDNGPISTGTKRSTEMAQTIIKLKDGSSVEAEAAWEDAQGIWYRRGGLVSFVERSRVDSITAAAEPRPATAEAPK